MVTPVRIGIATRSPLCHVAIWHPGAVFIDGHPVFSLTPGYVYSISGGKISECVTGRSFVLPNNERAQLASRDQHGCYTVWANNRWYRGSLELITYAHAETLINLLDLEDYLPGVVPSEMPANWHLEALKAQAVAARSYAWAHLGHGSKWLKSEGYDLVPDVRDQMYKGLAAEAKSTNFAVQCTSGIVLKDANRVKPGFYRAWVGDEFENLNIRQTSVSTSVLEKITGVPNIVGVTVKHWDPVTSNAVSLQVIGANKKSREVSGIALARMMHFSTAGILDTHEEGPNWIFTYRGPGNGSRGLSQHGANILAKQGWNYEQILRQYYQDPDGKLHLDLTDSQKILRQRYQNAMARSALYRKSQGASETHD